MGTQLGLRANWKQFSLLVFINALVGGMIGLERSILPSLASESFGMESHAVMFSFIVVFGIMKTIANYYAGHFANHNGRKN